MARTSGINGCIRGPFEPHARPNPASDVWEDTRQAECARASKASFACSRAATAGSRLTAYGLEESAWAKGFVRGFLDADFLSPLPARSGFEENDDWIALLDLLDKYLPTLEAELDGHLAARRVQQATEVGERALRLARDILDLDEFRDLALPGGLAKRGRPETTTTRAAPSGRTRRRSGEPSKAPGQVASTRGRRIRYEEVPFEAGSTAHSRFAAGVVQANTLHPDFQQAARSGDARLAYAALMIGKESIAFNDRTGAAGDFLEKLLDFYFKLNAKKSKRGKARIDGPDQEGLDLTARRSDARDERPSTGVS